MKEAWEEIKHYVEQERVHSRKERPRSKSTKTSITKPTGRL